MLINLKVSLSSGGEELPSEGLDFRLPRMSVMAMVGLRCRHAAASGLLVRKVAMAECLSVALHVELNKLCLRRYSREK